MDLAARQSVPKDGGSRSGTFKRGGCRPFDGLLSSGSQFLKYNR